MSTTRIDKLANWFTIMAPNNSFTGFPHNTTQRLPAASAMAASRVCAMTEKKKFWYSKTTIFGALQLAAGTLALFAGSDLIQAYPEAVAAIAAASGVVTIGLRIVTSLPIEW